MTNPALFPASKRPWHHLASLGLVLLAFSLSALLSRAAFDRLPHLEDELAYLFQARIFASGQATVNIPEPRQAYWQPFVVDYAPTGQRFAKYSPGWPLLLALGVLLGQPWLINALLSALNVALVYRLGSDLLDRDTGLMAALLLTFSPMALLLNASLMAHTSALTFGLVFMWTFHRLARRQQWAWAIVAGLALGSLAITRPLPALALAMPAIVLSLIWLARAYRRKHFGRVLRPLLLLAALTILVGLLLPLFNAAATGDPRQNLYTLVWTYDRVGFGDCCGRNGHTLDKALLHARYDLSLTAADLFGWQIGPLDDAVRDYWLDGNTWYPNPGVSFLLIPFGLLVGLGRRWWAGGLWLLIGLLWLLPLLVQPDTFDTPLLSWGWLIGALIWSWLPLLWLRGRARATWWLLSVAVSLILLQMAYWVGSQRYSTRYYFEAVALLSLLTALPLSWLARQWGRRLALPVYGALVGVCMLSLVSYSWPRVMALHGFNNIRQAHIDAVESRRTTDAPLLVIVEGPASGADRVRWRAYGSLMAVTGPRLDTPIVVAWDYGGDDVREAILARFPDREVILMIARENHAWFPGTSP